MRAKKQRRMQKDAKMLHRSHYHHEHASKKILHMYVLMYKKMPWRYGAIARWYWRWRVVSSLPPGFLSLPGPPAGLRGQLRYMPSRHFHRSSFTFSAMLAVIVSSPLACWPSLSSHTPSQGRHNSHNKSNTELQRPRASCNAMFGRLSSTT